MRAATAAAHLSHDMTHHLISWQRCRRRDELAALQEKMSECSTRSSQEDELHCRSLPPVYMLDEYGMGMQAFGSRLWTAALPDAGLSLYPS